MIGATESQEKETIKMKSPHGTVVGLLAGVLAGLLLAGAASALEVGQKAPDFTLNGTDGKPVKLSDLTAKGPIVLYTFIAAFRGT
jgi:cytochrome oxidase Cu insertion factor (SCO1/SenC/PrrC family)